MSEARSPAAADFATLDKIGRLALLALLLFCTAAVMTGPFRAALATVRLAPLIYLPTFAMIAMLPLLQWWRFRVHGMTRVDLAVLLYLSLTLMSGLLTHGTTQALFGTYVLLPFFFGIVVGPLVTGANALSFAPIAVLWSLATFGVLLNNFVTYPWEGFLYEVGGVEVESSREWTVTGGGKRLAGLARASFDAAIQVQLLALLFVGQLRSRLLMLLVWALSGVAIVLTTAKGIYNTFAVLTLVFLVWRRIPEAMARALPLTFGTIGLYLPLSTHWTDYRFRVEDPTLANMLFSFYERLNQMWPEAWELLAQHCASPIAGCGFGGIGTAQAYFQPLLFNAADNVFVYWIVTLGWPSLLLLVPLVLSTVLMRPWTRPDDRLPYLLALATLVYGITTNVVENPFFALACGVATRHVARRLIEFFNET